MKMIWRVEGSFENVVETYSKLKSNVTQDILKRRKKLFSSLSESLLVPPQKELLNYASRNADNILIFEGGGTFGFFVNNFLDVLYADVLTSELRKRGKNAVNFLVIDPTDISRFERTLLFAGRKIKIPLPDSRVSAGKSTQSLKAPTERDVKTFINSLEKELELYFQDVWRANHGFKREVEKRENFSAIRNYLRKNFNSLKCKIYDFAKESSNYRNFTDKLLIELISPLISNSIFVTLNQWQSAWNISEQFKTKTIYEEIDEIYEKISEKNLKLKREDGRYIFPFRIDNMDKIFPVPIADLNEKKVYASEMEIGKKDALKYDIDDLFSRKFNLIPQGGLLYAFDSLAYDAIPLAPVEPRVLAGFYLADRRKKTKRFLSQYPIQFYSIGRKTKSSPEPKVSGAVASYIEGIDSKFVKEVFKSRTQNDFFVESPIYSEYKQPEC